jgi:hypothetical protein
MKILGKIFDLFSGLLYSFLFTTVFIEREDLINNWQWWVGGTFAIGICYTLYKWNKDEIDILKEEIDKLKMHIHE